MLSAGGNVVEKILIIDDSKMMVKILSDILGQDYDVFTLTSGNEAVQTAKSINPSLILLDIIMPGLSGFDVISDLKKCDETMEIPVIFLTGVTDDSEEERGFKLGAVDYITKPFHPTTVKARVRSHVNMFVDRKQLYREREYSNTILRITDDAIFDYDIDARTVRFSQNFAAKFDIPEFHENFPEALIKTGLIAEDSHDDVIALGYGADDTCSDESYELHLRLPTGELVWYSLNFDVISNDAGKAIRVVGKLSDITKHKEKMDDLTKRAETDSLTRLFNKMETKRRIERAIHEDPDMMSALIMIDIDNFKAVNDNLGHQFGDSVIIDVARNIKKLFRSSDVVGRVGGDEFVVFMNKICSLEIVKEKTDELCQALRHTYVGGKSEYKISASIGAAISPDHGSSFDELYKMSDLALYESKRQGKDRATIYHDGIQEDAKKKNEAATDMDRLVANFFANDHIYNIFQILYETKDVSTSVMMVLEIVGNLFNIDRCYIFQSVCEDVSMVMTYEWTSAKVDKYAISMNHEISASDMIKILPLYRNEGIIYCEDVSSLGEDVRRVFLGPGEKALMQSVMYQEGKIKGLIGFSDCRNTRVWKEKDIAMLSYISRVLSIFVMKKQISNELIESYHKLPADV